MACDAPSALPDPVMTPGQVTHQSEHCAMVRSVPSPHCAHVALPDDGQGIPLGDAQPPHVEVSDNEPVLPLGFSLPGDGPWDSRPFRSE